MSLESKYGPAAESLSVEQATARIAAYERMVSFASAAAATLRAPAFYLSDQQLAGLFAPQQFEVLVMPLHRPEPNCPDSPQVPQN
jgi:hypothetical protein